MVLGNKIRIKSEEELSDFIKVNLSEYDSDSDTIISSGHFMLVFDKARRNLVPGIISELEPGRFNNLETIVGSFPYYTWKIGCKIGKSLKQVNKSFKLALLINDWQLVPIDTERDESQPNKYRHEFYSNFKSLPSSYEDLMKKYDLDFYSDILRNRNGDFYYKEISLRDRFLRKIKKDSKSDNYSMWNICDLSLDRDNSIIFNREEEEPLPLIIKSKVGCSGGVAQMMIDIGLQIKKKNNPKINFINLMPMSCLTQVNAASELAINFLTALDKKLEVTVVNFFFESRNITDTLDYYKSPAVYGYKFSGHAQKKKQ